MDAEDLPAPAVRQASYMADRGASGRACCTWLRGLFADRVSRPRPPWAHDRRRPAILVPPSRGAAAVSRSPRRLLRRAADALASLEDVAARYADARAELERGLTVDGVAELARAAKMVRQAADTLDGSAVGGAVPLSPEEQS